MFKFIQQYAEKMQDANIYPVISLLIFLTFFIILLIWVKKMRKEEVDEFSHLPFDKNEPANTNL